MTAASVIVLPGMDGTGLLLDAFADRLGRCRPVQVLAYPRDRPWGYAELAAQVSAALPHDGAFVLLGESFSGPLALSIAATRPPGLIGVVLAASFAQLPLRVPLSLQWLANLLPLGYWPASMLARRGAEAMLLGVPSTPALRSALGNALAQVAPRVLRHRLCEVLRIDSRPALAQIRVPILALRAEQDRLIGEAAVQVLRAGGGDVRIMRLRGPHGLLQVAPAASAAAVEAFVAALDRPGQSAADPTACLADLSRPPP